jgi:hypothetical protein
MTEPRIVELWSCGYTARCSAGMPPARHYDPALPRRPGRPDRQTALATPTRATYALR